MKLLDGDIAVMLAAPLLVATDEDRQFLERMARPSSSRPIEVSFKPKLFLGLRMAWPSTDSPGHNRRGIQLSACLGAPFR
jgi:hypothetical protein